VVQFVFSKDIDQAMQDVRDAMSAVRPQLPQEILEPVMNRFDPTQLPIVSHALTSRTLSTPQLTQLADQTIGGELRSIAGVAQVTIVGGDSAQLNINVRPSDLAAAGVGIDQVVNTIRAQNLAAPVGRVNAALENRVIRLDGRLGAPSDFADIVVAERSGQVVRLGQLADVEAGAAEPTSAALFYGVPAIGLDIIKSREASTTGVGDAVRARVAELQATLPAGVSIEFVRDGGARVRRSVSNVQETLFEGALLTVLVVFLFLNSWRSTVITGLALPVSVLTAFAPLLLFGFSLNVMSLMGLSLAIGILIDDAIVVRENIVRHVEMGKDHVTASHEGTDEIGLAVAATTFSIVAVFVPVGFMPGIAGQLFKPFALTIASAVLVSLFVSFSLDPMLSAYWPDPELESHEHRSWISRKLVTFNGWFDRQASATRYHHWALDHRWWMIGIATTTLVLALWLQVAFGFRLPAGHGHRRAERLDRDAARVVAGVHDTQGRGSRAPDPRAHGRGGVYLHNRWQLERLGGRRRSDGLCAHGPQAETQHLAARLRAGDPPRGGQHLGGGGLHDDAAGRQPEADATRGAGPRCAAACHDRRASRRLGARRPRRGRLRALDPGADPRAGDPREPGTRVVARRERRAAGHVAALRLGRGRRGDVGRSVGDLALRARAPGAGCALARRRRRAARSCSPGSVRRTGAAMHPLCGGRERRG
jgi:hypothetical protein